MDPTAFGFRQAGRRKKINAPAPGTETPTGAGIAGTAARAAREPT